MGDDCYGSESGRFSDSASTSSTSTSASEPNSANVVATSESSRKNNVVAAKEECVPPSLNASHVSLFENQPLDASAEESDDVRHKPGTAPHDLRPSPHTLEAAPRRVGTAPHKLEACSRTHTPPPPDPVPPEAEGTGDCGGPDLSDPFDSNDLVDKNNAGSMSGDGGSPLCGDYGRQDTTSSSGSSNTSLSFKVNLGGGRSVEMEYQGSDHATVRKCSGDTASMVQAVAAMNIDSTTSSLNTINELTDNNKITPIHLHKNNNGK